MTIAQLLYAVTLAALGGILSYAAGTTRRESRSLVIFFEVSFWLRAVAVFANERFDFFPQKFATNISLDLINQPGGILGLFRGFDIYDHKAFGQLKFLLEAGANLPGILLFENSHVTLNLTNCLVGAIAGLAVFAYMRRLLGRNAAVFAMLLTSLYPGAFNFSIFGIRDIFLYSFILINLSSVLWLSLRRDHRSLHAALYGLSLAFIAILRSAFLPFMFVLPVYLIGWGVARKLGDIPDPDQRRRLARVAAAAATIVAGIALVGCYGIVLHHVGINSFVRPDHLLKDYVEARASCGTRYAGTYHTAHGLEDGCVPMESAALHRARGVGSQYISFDRYQRTPWVVRELVQVVGFVVIPLPWQIDRLSRGLALIDSAFVIATMCIAWRACRPSPVLPNPPDPRAQGLLRALGIGLLLGFVVSWLGFGLIVTDGGNAFRLRLTVEPFAILGASLYLASLSRLNERADRIFEKFAAMAR